MWSELVSFTNPLHHIIYLLQESPRISYEVSFSSQCSIYDTSSQSLHCLHFCLRNRINELDSVEMVRKESLERRLTLLGRKEHDSRVKFLARKKFQLFKRAQMEGRLQQASRSRPVAKKPKPRDENRFSFDNKKV